MVSHTARPRSKPNTALIELRKLRDLWTALNDAIAQQNQAVRNDIADRYRLHRLYARHFPEDHALARQQRTNAL